MPITGPIAGFDPIQLNSFMQEYGENVIYDDFLYGNQGGSSFVPIWNANSSGGSIQFPSAFNNVVGHPGILEMDTVAGPPATNKIGITNLSPLFPLSNSYWAMSWLVQLPAFADTFAARFGIGNVSGTVEFTDAVYFEFDNSVSAFWQLCAANGGTRTKSISAVTVSAATWYLLTQVGTSTTNVNYFVNGVFAGAVTTNLPSANVTPATQLFKLTGNPNMSVLIDLCYFGCAYAAFR